MTIMPILLIQEPQDVLRLDTGELYFGFNCTHQDQNVRINQLDWFQDLKASLPKNFNINCLQIEPVAAHSIVTFRIAMPRILDTDDLCSRASANAIAMHRALIERDVAIRPVGCAQLFRRPFRQVKPLVLSMPRNGFPLSGVPASA